MVTLIITSIIFFNGHLGFLMPVNVQSSMACFENDIKVFDGAKESRTYHRYKLPQGNLSCSVMFSGEGITFPSTRDILTYKFKVDN